MPVTRRRILTGPFDRLGGFDWISARGREGTRGAGQAAPAGAGLVRISSNENPLGPGAHVLDAIRGAFSEAARYPVNATRAEGTLVARLAAALSTTSDRLLLGPGSGELLTHAVRAFTSPTRPLVTAWPSFEAPRDTATKIGTPVREVGFDAGLRIDLAKMAEASRGAGLVFFCNPNNPTATVHGKTAVSDLVRAIRTGSPDTVILIDEAYHDYVTDPAYASAVPLALATPNVFVTRTFSKAFGMAGLRAGYAVGDRRIITALDRYKMPNGLGTLTLSAALAGLANQTHIDHERRRNNDVRAFTVKAFADLGVTGTASQANFLFMDIRRPAAGFRDACRAAGVLVGRDFPPFEKQYCRVSLGTMDEMRRAAAVFKTVLGGAPTTSRQQAGR